MTNTQRQTNILAMVQCSLFVALIAAGAFIKVPLPVVPFTLQILFTNLAGILLGKKYGRKIQKGKIYYLGENDSKKITEVIFTEENLKRAIDDFNSVAEKILAENYETKFDLEKEKCASCIFAAYCKNENRI